MLKRLEGRGVEKKCNRNSLQVSCLEYTEVNSLEQSQR